MSVYGNPIRVLIDRLTYHTAPGEIDRLLSGWKFYAIPGTRVDGATDFPAVQFLLPDVSEGKVGRLINGALQIKLGVSTRRSDGIPALLDAAALVLNAVETDHQTGRTNAGLNGTLACPPNATVGNCFSNDLSLNAEITLSMQPGSFERGQR